MKSTADSLSTTNGGSSHSRFNDVSNVSCVPVKTASTAHANRQSHSNLTPTARRLDWSDRNRSNAATRQTTPKTPRNFT
eukprot:6209380-Pleurochrysis_carterae.AAC.3